MKNRVTTIKLSLGALALGAGVAAHGAQFFRIAGPVATKITALSTNGYITWTNSPTNATFAVQTAQSLPGRTNWVDYIRVAVTNAVTTQRIYDPNPPSGMALIPAGSFTMGNCMDPDEGYDQELPLHTVYVGAFYMDKYLVTYSLWTNVYQWATNHGYTFSHAGSGKTSTDPVQTIEWYDCVMWCNARSEKEGLVPAYYLDAAQTTVYRTGTSDLLTNDVNWSAGYRLPTEAEWEKAARGGASGQRFPWGNTISWGQANYYADPGSVLEGDFDVNPTSGYDPTFDGVFPYTSPVEYFAPNGYGLYDMAGNVAEWCWDWYNWYSAGSQTDPRGPASGNGRVYRGGSWYESGIFCRTAYRDGNAPWLNDTPIGFRSVLPPGQ